MRDEERTVPSHPSSLIPRVPRPPSLVPPPAKHGGFIQELLFDALRFGVVRGQAPFAKVLERLALNPPLQELRKPCIDGRRGPPDALLTQEERVGQRFRVTVGLAEDANVNGIALQARPVKVEALQRRPRPPFFPSLAFQTPLFPGQIDLSLLFETAAKPKHGVESETEFTHG